MTPTLPTRTSLLGVERHAARKPGLGSAGRVAGASLVAATVAAVAVALGAVGVSGAHARDLRLGVHTKSATVSELSRMSQGGAEVMRHTFLWIAVQPTEDGPYRWSMYDTMVTQASLNGVTLLPYLSGSPRYAAAAQSYPPTSDADLRRWKRFVRAAVARYGPGGQFWSEPENRALPYRPIRAWQVWNEPNMDDFWADDPKPKEFARLLKLSSNAIRKANPQVKVVFPGMGRWDTTLGRYMDRLYDVRGVKRAFDIGAIHPYGDRPADVVAGARTMRRILDSHGDDEKPLWVTETGWGAGGPPRRYMVSYRTQAEYLLKTFRRLRDEASELNLGTVIWFSWRDVRTNTGIAKYFWQFCGLFTYDGSPKPSWDAFVRFADGRAGHGPLLD